MLRFIFVGALMIATNLSAAFSDRKEIFSTTEMPYRLRAEGSQIYWMMSAGLQQPVSIYSMNPAADGKPQVLCTGDYVDYAVQKGELYLVDSRGRVLKGTASPQVLSSERPYPLNDVQNINLVDGNIYLSIPDTRQIAGVHSPKHPGYVLQLTQEGKLQSQLDPEDGARYMGFRSGKSFVWYRFPQLFASDDGKPKRTLASDDRDVVMAYSVRGGNVYYTAGGELRKIPVNGGTMEVLARGEILLKVATDDESIYALRNTSYAQGKVSQHGALLRIRLGGTQVEEMGDHVRPSELLATADGVFVFDTRDNKSILYFYPRK